MSNIEHRREPLTTVVTRLPAQEAERLAKMATQNERTVAQETRLALRRHMAKEASAGN